MYNNQILGLIIVFAFLLVLTVGFVFEFGKGALKINSRQTANLQNNTWVYRGKSSVNLYPTFHRRSYSTKSNGNKPLPREAMSDQQFKEWFVGLIDGERRSFSTNNSQPFDQFVSGFIYSALFFHSFPSSEGKERRRKN
jgi:hypothetical protein